jgi:uncharacterized protein YfdQ (DUF2303 family)
MEIEIEGENIAQTLARELPTAAVVFTDHPNGEEPAGRISYVAVPKNFDLKPIDNEALLAHPRRTKATATLTTPESFIEYVKKFGTPATMVWCHFNPQSFALSFAAVIDENAPNNAGWRSHQAKYTPEMSAEWKTWTGDNKKSKSQIDFAEFLERHEKDIASVEGFPTSLDMMTLATEFVASSEKRVKSVVRLQGGGVRLDYVEDDDAATLTAMKLFDKFAVGIPVFWAGPGYRIDARLKYRQAQGAVSFWYDLIRPDVVHEASALELIEKVRDGIAAVPLLMGTST